jgi:putative N-acetylmannosamine-6-phosphate epimerase
MPVELGRGLIVSCQAEDDSPFNMPHFIAAFAKAAEMGGALGVRVCGLDNLRAVRAAVRLPIIGITKDEYADGWVLVTATLDDVSALFGAGADLVAVDATFRARPDGLTGTEVVREAVARGLGPIVADVSTFEEGVAAAEGGAAFVATTLSGYTAETRPHVVEEPALDLVARLARELPGRLIAEGRIWTPDEARRALDLGAHAVVVGTAITRPTDIVQRFVRVLTRP